MSRTWLPEGMEELAAPDSWRAEDLRRKLLDGYRRKGYELILTPLVEHLEALLAGAGADLEPQIFKLVDPASGRLLGLRADMTPQAARIAARRYARQKIVRLCYIGTVLRTRSDSPGGPRSPRQVGCELFGDPRVAADIEILQLMLETLQRAGVRNVHLDLGHVGVYRALAARLALPAADESRLFGIVQRKSLPDLRDFARQQQLDARALRSLTDLIELNGGVAVLSQARAALARAGAGTARCLDTLEHTVQALRKLFPKLPVHIDLAELRGSRYHTGLVFAAFAPGHGRELARGGRYDGGGDNAARPATGFSADLNELLRLGK